MGILPGCYLLALFVFASGAKLAAPPIKLVEHPADVLVTEGDEAILKCKTSGEATRCKWLLNRTDNPYELVDVKEFYPKREGDCSIRIRQVRPAHVGKWVCSVFFSGLHEELVSRPASVAIATLSARSRHPAIMAQPANATALPGQPVDLECKINAQVGSCGWAMPDDVVITISAATMSLLDELPLSFRGDLAAGDCAIRVDAMEERFAGQWSCLFEMRDETVWTSPAHLRLASAQARTGPAVASVSPGVAAVLVLSALAVLALVTGVVLYRRRSQLRHAKLQENPLYGIKNLQMAAAASAASRKATEQNRLNSGLAAEAPTKGLQELGSSQRAPPNHYFTRGSEEHKYAHVYDIPKGVNVYDVPSSKESYQVPRSSYEIPPAPVKVSFPDGYENNVYEEVKSNLFKNEDTEGYLIPQEKLKF